MSYDDSYSDEPIDVEYQYLLGEPKDIEWKSLRKESLPIQMPKSKSIYQCLCDWFN